MSGPSIFGGLSGWDRAGVERPPNLIKHQLKRTVPAVPHRFVAVGDVAILKATAHCVVVVAWRLDLHRLLLIHPGNFRGQGISLRDKLSDHALQLNFLLLHDLVSPHLNPPCSRFGISQVLAPLVLSGRTCATDAHRRVPMRHVAGPAHEYARHKSTHPTLDRRCSKSLCNACR